MHKKLQFVEHILIVIRLILKDHNIDYFHYQHREKKQEQLNILNLSDVFHCRKTFLVLVFFFNSHEKMLKNIKRFLYLHNWFMLLSIIGNLKTVVFSFYYCTILLTKLGLFLVAQQWWHVTLVVLRYWVLNVATLKLWCMFLLNRNYCVNYGRLYGSYWSSCHFVGNNILTGSNEEAVNVCGVKNYE
jgi:hypothetical protein